jgi:8-oxo-dGTP pyrophosphatase MutT (NUDIX family)
MQPDFIRVIAICVFHDNGRVLVFQDFDSIKQTAYYRPLGGGIEPGETSQDTVRREIREELDLEVTNLKLLGVLENLFSLEGKPSHEVVFVYDGEFEDSSVYAQTAFHAGEHDGSPLSVLWRDLDFFDGRHQLVPEGLLALLACDA